MNMKLVGVAVLIVVAIGAVYLLLNNNRGEMGETDEINTMSEIGSFEEISVAEANDMIQANQDNPEFALLDVRTAEEISEGVIAHQDIVLTPLDFYNPGFKAELDKLDKNKTYLVYCRSGNRSGQTITMMKDLGFTNVYDIQGGIIAWRDAGLATEILE